MRGTHYEAVLESSKSLVLAAWQGGIRVRNEQGMIDLGMGADYNFARTGSEQPPQGLLEPPPALQSEAPIGQAQPAEQQAAAEDGTTEQAEGDTAGTDTAAPTDSAVKSGDAEGPGAAPPPECAPPPPMDSALGAPLANGLDTGCGTCAPPQQIVVKEPTDLPARQICRLTGSALQHQRMEHAA